MTDGNLLYLTSVLPKRSETFVYREVFGLRAQGLQIVPVSLHKPQRDLGDPALDALAREAIQVYPAGGLALVRDAIFFTLRNPSSALRVFGRAVRDFLAASDLSTGQRLRIIPQIVAALALAWRAHSFRPTGIHVHMAHAPATVGMYAAQALRVPFSFTGHAVDLFREASLLPEKLSRAAFVACISHWHREWYRSILNRPEGDYPIVRCGVDVPEVKRSAQRGELRLLGIARLVPKKGFDTLLESLREAAGEGVSFRCTIAGEGPEDSRLRQLAEDPALAGRISFVGAVNHSQVSALLREADVFVLPCRVVSDGDRDGIPVSVMEAMAAGVCVVTGDLPAIRELVEDGVSGLLVPPGEPHALASALRKLSSDPGFRTKLASAGRARVVEEFSSNENLQRLVWAFRSHQML